jgi:hypothetical protein
MKAPMTKSGLLSCAILAAALSAPFLCAAQAYDDWTVQCDNVNHCEAVGYGSDRETARWIAVQLVRDAGPATAVKAKVVLAEDGPEKPAAIAITVDEFRSVPIRANQPIPQAAVHQLLDRMIEGRAGQASDGQQQWALPLAGMKAALLRMDALQGRIGTPGALVRRGTRPEAAVPPARAMPVLRAAPRAEVLDDPEIVAALLAETGPSHDGWADGHSLHRLATGLLLFLRETARGSSSRFYDVWIANARRPYQPRRLSLPNIGPAEDTLVNANFDGQVLSTWDGRFLYEFRDATEWLWTGARFELLTVIRADNCYGMLHMIDNRKWVARRVD